MTDDTDTADVLDPADALDPDDRVLVVALATGLTQDAAGSMIGRSGRTVRRRLADPGFAAAVHAEREANAQRIADLLAAQCAAAAERLARVVQDGTDRDAVGASRVLLAEARQHRETAYIADRLAHVETLLLNQQATR